MYSSPQFAQTAAGTPLITTVVCPRSSVTVVEPRVISPNLQIVHLTSASAELLLMDAGFTKKHIKARIDKLAAQIMLQAFLDQRRADAATRTP